MSRTRPRRVVCTVKGRQSIVGRRRKLFKQYALRLDLTRDLTWKIRGELGPHGISPEAADLMDFAAVVYRLERLFKRQRINPPRKITLDIPMRVPSRWDDRAKDAAKSLLLNLGLARWEFKIKPGVGDVPLVNTAAKVAHIENVVLFSGGLDSLCGAATLRNKPGNVKLISFYRKEKNLQLTLANALGFEPPAQFSFKWLPGKHVAPGRSFYYRSFLFLALGAVVADSWGVRRILQFENGILAGGIPPAPSWRMTRHAHPWTRKYAGQLFSCLLGGKWEVLNPFELRTKAESMTHLSQLLGGKLASNLASQTETCWNFRQAHVFGKKKTNNVACGVCVPCLVRRTALPRERPYFDLNNQNVRNDKRLGAALRDFWIFLLRVNGTRNRAAEFYRLLPADWRTLLYREESMISLRELHSLYLHFYDEFRRAFHLR